MYDNFMLFHVAIYVFACDSAGDEWIDYAQSLITEFVKQSIELYGDTFAVYNVHSLIHIVDDVQNFGPLDGYSAFSFENHMKSINKLIRHHNKEMAQVAKQLAEISVVKDGFKMYIISQVCLFQRKSTTVVQSLVMKKCLNLKNL